MTIVSFAAFKNYISKCNKINESKYILAFKFFIYNIKIHELQNKHSNLKFYEAEYCNEGSQKMEFIDFFRHPDLYFITK